MKRNPSPLLALGAIAALVMLGVPQRSLSAPGPESASGTKPRLLEGYGALPLSFEANQGQTSAAVQFLAHGPGYGLFLTPTEAVLTLQGQQGPSPRGNKPTFAASPGQPHAVATQPPLTLRLKLLGANPKPIIVGLDALPGKVNYLRGNDPKRWHTNIPTYRQVKYAQVYPGIDLVYYGNPRQLEHDFVVAPGTDPAAIALEIEGAGQPSIDAKGDLVLANPRGAVRFQKPVIYQEVNGRRQMVAGAYVLTGAGRLGFRVGAYDPTRPLVIDPVLVYSTYLGGSDGGLWIWDRGGQGRQRLRHGPNRFDRFPAGGKPAPVHLRRWPLYWG